MEKMVAGFGLSMLMFFFLLGFCISNIWLWGCVPGGALALFGLAFWAD